MHIHSAKNASLTNCWMLGTPAQEAWLACQRLQLLSLPVRGMFFLQIAQDGLPSW